MAFLEALVNVVVRCNPVRVMFCLERAHQDGIGFTMQRHMMYWLLLCIRGVNRPVLSVKI
jgi:hypothetical protein